MADKEMVVIDAGNLEGRAFMNPADMKELGIDEFDYVQIVSEYEDWGAVQVLSSDEIEAGTIAVDTNVLDSANINDGDTVRVSKAKIMSAPLREIKLGVEPLRGQPVEECVSYISENIDELATVLRHRPMMRGLQITWNDAGCGPVKLRFMESVPDIPAGEIGIIEPSGREITIKIVPATEMAFNAILVIDVSGSMAKEDMQVRNISTAIEGLRRGLKPSPELEALLSSFETKKVARKDAAALATLLFLSLKVAKGWGEQIQVITFADDVETFMVEMNGVQTSVIKCTGEAKELGLELIANYIAERTQNASGLTFMSGALKAAYEAIEKFDINPRTNKRNPTMIILLTDGEPNKGDGIGVNPVPIVRKYAEMYPDSALYTIGVGEADRKLLSTLAKIGRGETFDADNVAELTKFYDTLARRFQLTIRARADELIGEEETEITESEEPMQ